MVWQDVVITVGVFVMILAMIPSVKGKNKPAKATSLTTGIILTTYFICFATLGLWLSAISESVLAVMWYVLFIQVQRANK